MKTLVIGDIHGGFKALKELIELAPININDQLIFLGDYVDGWSDSYQVLNYLLELSHIYNCIFIKGNHDVWLEQWLLESEPSELWLQHGGESTIESYKHVSQTEKIKHLDFLKSAKLYHVDNKNRLFIHAGYTSMHGPQKEFHQSNYNWDRTLWEMALVMDKRIKKHSKLYPKRLKLYEEIYIGHTPTLNYDVDTPMNAINIWNIDTGAAFTGKISMMDIESNEFWQSTPVYQLYPNEKGRNK